MNRTDEELIAAYVDQGVRSAYDELVSRHAGWVYGIARRTLADEHAAHDVTQAVFLLLSQRAARLRNRSRLGAWLITTTRLSARQHLRTERRRRRREAIAARQTVTATVATSATHEILTTLDQAIAGLGARDRQLVAWRFYQGLSMADIGHRQAVSEDTARKRVAAAVAKLRRTFERRFAHADSSAALAMLPMFGRSPVPDVDWPRFTRQTASRRAVRLAKGVTNMLKIKQAIMVAALVLFPISGALIVRAQLADYPEVAAPAAPPTPLASPYLNDDGDVMKRTIYTEQYLIRVSADGRQMNGYSMTRGTLAKAPPIAGTLDVSHVIAGTSVAIYPAQMSVLGYSPMTGTWDALPLKAGTKVTHPVVCAGFAYVTIDEQMYVFSASTGKWSEPIP
ncbi:MAG: RNA polymerase sigma factor [Tepidisphaeraceae bacterium]